MRNGWGIAAMIIGCLGGAWAQCGGTLIWSDEFNGTSLNTSNWTYDNLTIEVRAENMGGRSFTSGKIHTNGKFSQTYGRFEASVRLSNGAGLWPAFWMLPTVNNWPTTGEIDILEFRGDMLNRVSGTLHYGNPWPQNQNDGSDYYHPVNDLHTTFHTYAVEWEPGEIRWYFDNIRYKTETQTPNTLNPPSNNANTWPWTTPYYIILNQAVGGWFTGVTVPANVIINKGTIEFDYVRVYDMTPSAGTQAPYFGTPSTLPGTIQAENFDRGCADAAYADQELANQGGQYRQEEVDIETCSDAGGGYNVGYINANEWLEYTVNATSGGLYNIDFRVAAQTAGGRIRMEIDGISMGTVNIPATGGWQNWQTVTLSSVSIGAGNHLVRMFFEAGNFNFNSFGTSLVTLSNDWLIAELHAQTLTWMSSETGLFQLQMLEHGSWKTVATVEAQDQHQQVYYWEQQPSLPIRIVQIMAEGNTIFSNILLPAEKQWYASPNPCRDILVVQGAEQELEWTTLLGVSVEVPYIQQGEVRSYTTSKLAPGVYILSSADHTMRVLKE
ncbi:MAG: family 16 glycosylhydrolase [Cytophagaceae bacterium]|nr:family 16 glycosylhydrolase [Cytophagaceae bacterium]